MRQLAVLFGVIVLSVVSLGRASADVLDDLRKAQDESSKSGIPILLAAGAEWCKDCRRFEKDANSSAALQSVLGSKVLLFQFDGEKDGKTIAEIHNIQRFPSFILTNSDGQAMDRWHGYTHVEPFLEHLEKAVKDPMPITDRIRRYRQTPTEVDAKKLGELRYYENLFAEAIAYYRRAQSLASDETKSDYDPLIFRSMSWGVDEGLYGLDDLHGLTHSILDRSDVDAETRLQYTYYFVKAALREGRPDEMVDFLADAVEKTEGIDSEKAKKVRMSLLPEYAIYIENDVEKAIAYRMQALPSEWDENANQLNNLAWWCFEHRVNLEQAEEWARTGVTLALPGSMKANILDTLAEICNLRGNCGEAVELIEAAIEEDPGNEYFQKQLVRFEDILNSQKQ